MEVFSCWDTSHVGGATLDEIFNTKIIAEASQNSSFSGGGRAANVARQHVVSRSIKPILALLLI